MRRRSRVGVCVYDFGVAFESTTLAMAGLTGGVALLCARPVLR